MRWGVNASYVLTRNASLYGSVYGEAYDSDVAGNGSLEPPDWFADSDDWFYTTSVGIRFPELTRRIGASVEYSYSTSDGEIDTAMNDDRSSFPDLETDRHRAELNVDYRHSSALTYRFSWWYEDYDSEDWALEGVEPDTVGTLLSLGVDPVRYDTHVFYVGVRYTFDTF